MQRELPVALPTMWGVVLLHTGADEPFAEQTQKQKETEGLQEHIGTSRKRLTDDMSVPWLLREDSWNGEPRIWRHRAETHSSKYHILDIFADSGVVFSSLDTRGLITILVFLAADTPALCCVPSCPADLLTENTENSSPRPQKAADLSKVLSPVNEIWHGR